MLVLCPWVVLGMWSLTQLIVVMVTGMLPFIQIGHFLALGAMVTGVIIMTMITTTIVGRPITAQRRQAGNTLLRWPDLVHSVVPHRVVPVL